MLRTSGRKERRKLWPARPLLSRNSREGGKLIPIGAGFKNFGISAFAEDTEFHGFPAAGWVGLSHYDKIPKGFQKSAEAVFEPSSNFMVT